MSGFIIFTINNRPRTRIVPIDIEVMATITSEIVCGFMSRYSARIKNSIAIPITVHLSLSFVRNENIFSTKNLVLIYTITASLSSNRGFQILNIDV